MLELLDLGSSSYIALQKRKWILTKKLKIDLVGSLKT